MYLLHLWGRTFLISFNLLNLTVGTFVAFGPQNSVVYIAQ